MLSSVANALRVLEFLVDAGEAGISDVARGLGFTVGTTFRIVSTLVEAGYVVQNPENRRYRPGPKIPDLARRMRGSDDFVELAHSHLERLRDEADETVNLGVLRDGQVVYLDRAVTDQPLAVAVRVGSQVPAYCTSLGRAILARSGEATVADYLDRLPVLARGQVQPAPTVEQLLAVLDAAREQGYAEDRGDFAEGISCVAAPVLGADGYSVAAVSISGPSPRIEPCRTDLTALVVRAANELSELLRSVGGGVGL